MGSRDGRIALYLTDHYRLLAPPPKKAEGDLCEKVRRELRKRGASFFADLTTAASAFPADVLKALWDLVWAGEVTNDVFSPLRMLGPATRRSGAGRRPRLPMLTQPRAAADICASSSVPESNARTGNPCAANRRPRARLNEASSSTRWTQAPVFMLRSWRRAA